MQATKQYEFGDSLAHMDIPHSFVNAMIRGGPGTAGAAQGAKTSQSIARGTRPSARPCVLMDMSGSMRYDGQYVNVKRMALALEGLIRREYPGDYLQFIEMYTFAKLGRAGRDRRT